VLPPTARLRSRAEFSESVRRGTRASTPALVVHLWTDQSGSTDVPPQAGFVVSRAVGRATIRNRVRRQLRHLVRDRLDRLPTGSRLVVRATPAATGRASVLLAGDLDRALDRLVGAPSPSARHTRVTQ
jgi:ribonuclease P protein component